MPLQPPLPDWSRRTPLCGSKGSTGVPLWSAEKQAEMPNIINKRSSSFLVNATRPRKSSHHDSMDPSHSRKALVALANSPM